MLEMKVKHTLLIALCLAVILLLCSNLPLKNDVRELNSKTRLITISCAQLGGYPQVCFFM